MFMFADPNFLVLKNYENVVPKVNWLFYFDISPSRANCRKEVFPSVIRWCFMSEAFQSGEVVVEEEEKVGGGELKKEEVGEQAVYKKS